MIGKKRPQEYRIVWANDPALRQLELPKPPADDATEDVLEAYAKAVAEAIKAHEKAHRIAREQQNWDELILPGQTPTFFVCSWIDDTIKRRWIDQVTPTERRPNPPLGMTEGMGILFRLAVTGAENYLGDPFKREPDPQWELIAPRRLQNDLGPAIGDLAHHVLAMENLTRPL